MAVSAGGTEVTLHGVGQGPTSFWELGFLLRTARVRGTLVSHSNRVHFSATRCLHNLFVGELAARDLLQ